MTITVSIPNNELSMQEDIDEKLCELEVKYGGNWRYSHNNTFIGELNLKDFLLNNGLTLVV